MEDKEIDQLHFATTEEWRSWLLKNHQAKTGIWMICYKKSSGRASISWSDAVDQALCFGWIDSIKRSVNEAYAIQYFGKRKAKSTWSKINKEKIERLIVDGLMEQAGLDSIALAKENGSWTILDEVEALIVPPDLEQALATEPIAADYFNSLSKSNKKMLLQWLVLAKQESTRMNRVREIVRCAAQREKPKPFR